MFTQNITLSAQIVSPLDHFHGLMVMVTVRPSSLHSGGSPMLKSSSTLGSPLVPNQYSGRYMSIWNSYRLRAPKRSAGVKGKITAGGKPGRQAQVTVPPRSGRSVGGRVSEARAGGVEMLIRSPSGAGQAGRRPASR